MKKENEINLFFLNSIGEVETVKGVKIPIRTTNKGLEECYMYFNELEQIYVISKVSENLVFENESEIKGI